MSEPDYEFFENNLVKCNKAIGKVFFWVMLAPFVFAFFTWINVWKIRYTYCLALFVYSFVITIIEFVLNSSERFPRFTAYYGMIALGIYVTFLTSNSMINIAICMGLVPVASTIYYDKKFTIKINIINYFCVVGGLIIRSTNILNSMIYIDYLQKPSEWLFAYVIGATMEMIILFAVTDLISYKTRKTHGYLLELSERQSALYDELTSKNAEMEQTQYKIIQFAARCLGGHDQVTGLHVVHTQEYLELIANGLRESGYYFATLTNEEIKTYANASLLHDIGKVKVPAEILNKKDELTSKEKEIYNAHTTEGKKLLDLMPRIADGHFNDIASQMAACHHENWDGSGFPAGLKGNEIPLCARILCAADMLDRLISSSNNPAHAIDEAMKFFDENGDKIFEKKISDTVVKLRLKIIALNNQFSVRDPSQQVL